MRAILQPFVIDVANWRADEQHFNYPEGARPKTAIFPPPDPRLTFINPARRYLYKRSDRKYPDQFWAEVVAYQVGGLLKVPVPPSFAAFDSERGDCGALIEWFYEDGKAKWEPGGNYMHSLIADYDRKRGEKHNFESICFLGDAFSAIRIARQDFKLYWAETFLFDALIGNTDRHQDNWGYLLIPSQGDRYSAVLCPLFDNGTSLGHERFCEALDAWSRAEYERYVRRGRNHMRWKITDDKGCGHFEMLEMITRKYPHVKAPMLKKITLFDMAAFEQKLEYLKALSIPRPLSASRARAYRNLIEIRREIILATLS